MCREDFIEVAVGADAILYLMGLAGLMGQRAIGNRVSLCGPMKLGVWTRGREDGTRAIFSGRAVGNLFSNGRAVCGGNGEAANAARRETTTRAPLDIRLLIAMRSLENLPFQKIQHTSWRVIPRPGPRRRARIVVSTRMPIETVF
jgi:hypothetical protein